MLEGELAFPNLVYCSVGFVETLKGLLEDPGSERLHLLEMVEAELLVCTVAEPS